MIFRSASHANGIIFGSSVYVGSGPFVSSQPVDHVGVYNVAFDIDVGAGVSGALSYALQTARPGFSINDAGLLSFDGNQPDPQVVPIVVIAYELAGQGGDSTVLQGFDVFLDLPTPAVNYYGEVDGYATAPGGTLKQDGDIDGEEFSTWEFTGPTAGASNTATPGGIGEYVVPSETGSYSFPWRYWNRNAITTGANVIAFDSGPTITLLGDPAVEVSQGEAYVDAGATAADNEDGDLTANIVVGNPVDTSVPNDYTVTYNVTDSDNNIATEVTRTVTVRAISPPRQRDSMELFLRPRGVATTLRNVPIFSGSEAAYLKGHVFGAADVKVRKDNGVFANIETNPVEIGTSGLYDIALSASEMDATDVAILFAAAEFTEHVVKISTRVTPGVYFKGVAGQRDMGIVMVDSLNSRVTGLAVSVQASKDGAPFAAVTGTVDELGSGMYDYAPSAADLSADKILFRATGTNAIAYEWEIYTTAI